MHQIVFASILKSSQPKYNHKKISKMKNSSSRSPNSLYLVVLYGLAVLFFLLLLWLNFHFLHHDDRAIIVVLGGGLLASGQVIKNPAAFEVVY